VPFSPDLAFQPSFLDGGPPAPDLGFAGLTRIELDDRSWVDVCPGWLGGSDAAFRELAAQARWEQRTTTVYERTGPEPRLTAGWQETDAPPLLLGLAQPLSQRYGVAFDRIWVNLYRDGSDSVAWHRDRNHRVMTRPLVATVSLGARRRFLLRPRPPASNRGSTRAAHELHPGLGDLIVMGGWCQAEWEHTVPKTARRVGPRMSVTIRHSEPAPGEQFTP
jgi:alkylated DNA repair dioxygenase AlkB